MSIQDDLHEAAKILNSTNVEAGCECPENGRCGWCGPRRDMANNLKAHAAAMDAASPVAEFRKDEDGGIETIFLVSPFDLGAVTVLYDRPDPPASKVVEAWQPIETAPKDGTRIIVWDNFEKVASFATWQGAEIGTPSHWPTGWRGSLYVIRPECVSTWHPLSAPPANLTGATNG